MDIVFGEIVYNVIGNEGVEVDCGDLKENGEDVVVYGGEEGGMLVVLIGESVNEG